MTGKFDDDLGLVSIPDPYAELYADCETFEQREELRLEIEAAEASEA